MKDFHSLREELNEKFDVKYAKSKRGPIYQRSFKSQKEAEKFLDDMRKQGMNGIVAKAGTPVSMQKMKDLQKEAVSPAQQAAIAISKKEKGEKPVEESTFMITVRKAGPGGRDLNMKVDGKDRNDAVAKWRKSHPKYKNDSVDVKPLATMKKKDGKYKFSYK